MRMGDRTVRRCAAVLAVLFCVGAPTSASAAPLAQTTAPSATAAPTGGPDQVSPDVRAAAMAQPAIVLLEVGWQGYVRDRATGKILDDKPVSATTWCTGAGVGGDGYLVTTGNCLAETSVAAAAFQQVVDRRVAAGTIRSDASADLLGELMVTATIDSDPEADNPPERTVLVRRAVTDGDPITATVVSVAAPGEGDVAILKINRANQPILPLAESISTGDQVVTLECLGVQGGSAGTQGGSSGQGSDGPVRPQSRTGTVTEVTPQVFVEPTAPVPPNALAGGVVVNHDAALVGLVDTSQVGGDVVVDAAVIRALLTDDEITTDLGQVDRDYRAGLDALYGGRYSEAIEKFDSVLAIIPSHVQAHAYRSQAQERRAEQGGGPAPTDDTMDRVNRWIRSHSGRLVGLGVLAAIVVFLAHRRRPRQEGATASGATIGTDEPAGAAVTRPTDHAPGPGPDRSDTPARR